MLLEPDSTHAREESRTELDTIRINVNNGVAEVRLERPYSDMEDEVY